MNIGFIGIGLMGQPMAARLLNAGITLTVYNRTPSKLAPITGKGAILDGEPAGVFETSDCVILMLSDAPAIDEVLFNDSVLPKLAGRTIIQMGTIAPAESQRICEQVCAAGGDYLEAPVLGSIPQATDGTLIVMVGATAQQYTQWYDLLKHFGENPLHIGEVGKAAALKLAINQLIGSLTAAFSLSLGLVQRHDIDVEVFMAIVRQSALYAPTFDKKLQRMLDRDFSDPNFPTRHLLKDMRLVLQEAEACQLHTAIMRSLCEMLEQATDSEHADADYSALFATIVPEQG